MPLPPASPTGAPLVTWLQYQAPAVGAGADTLDAEVGVSEHTGFVTRVRFVPAGAVAGAANPNNRTFNLVDSSQADKVVATATLVAGVNLVNDTEFDLTLSATDTSVNAGDALSWASVHNGTGVADPGGSVTVEITSYAG